jgi:hypothetical protein
MKRKIKMLMVVFAMGMLFTSCFKYTTIVGEGAQGNREVSEWNHYLLWGLASVGVSDPQELAGDAENYDVLVEHTFLNGLVRALTFGIYTPTTTKIIK